MGKVRQSCITNYGRNKRLLQAVNDIIYKHDAAAVAKPVRAGMTTSAVYLCEGLKIPLLVLSPTNRIINETVGNASIDMTRIPANADCLFNKRLVDEYPILNNLPMPLPDCSKCEHNKRCELYAIYRQEGFSTCALTYKKLEALILSGSENAREALKKISRAGVVLLDEAHLLSMPAGISVKVFDSIPLEDTDQVLSKVLKDFVELCHNNESNIASLMKNAEFGHSGKHLAMEIINPKPINWDTFSKAIAVLVELAKSGSMSLEDVLKIRDIISIMASEELKLGYVSEDEGRSGSVFITARQSSEINAIGKFLREYMPHARLLFCSGTLVEPHIGFFSELAGREVSHIVFPDIRNASVKMTLVPDRYKLTSWNFNDKLPDIIEKIKMIHEREKQPIYLLAPNAKKASEIKELLGDLDGVTIDYYRSDKSIGVERKERVCIAVGMAETPANTFDTIAIGSTPEELWINSRMIRQQGVHAATWQAVNRVRDPSGTIESTVYFIGCKLEQVKQVARWGSNRRLEVVEIKERTGSDGDLIRIPVFRVVVDEPIPTPNITGTTRDRKHVERRNLGDYIKDVIFYKDQDIYSENHYNCSIIYSREFGVEFGFYNYADHKIALVIESLKTAFVNRDECFGKQYLGDLDKWGYYRVNGKLNEKELLEHYQGNQTLGTYQISLDDTVKWSCIDIDAHNGEKDTKEKVECIIAILRRYNLPFLLEASGSKDSYHIWIFHKPTRTYNAYRFVRQIKSEAQVECEVFPKQQKLSGDSKYGNMVKIPLCLNQKSGNRSVFLDPDTFEPLEDFIAFPGYVNLLDMPSDKPRTGALKSMPQPYTRTSGTSLDYCMICALQDKIPLQGSDGHEFRVAIVVRAQNIGMTAEDTAKLFENQKDYNYEFSLKKVDEVRSRNYGPWKCSTLKDKCGSIVGNYCPSCPKNRSRSSSRMACGSRSTGTEKAEAM